MKVKTTDQVVDGKLVSRLKIADDNGAPFDPTSVKLVLVGPSPASAQLEVEFTGDARKSRIQHPSTGNYKHAWWWLPSQAGSWSRRWVVDGNVVGESAIDVPAAPAA